MKLNKILFIVGLCLVTLGLALFIAGSILSFTKYGKASDLLLAFSSIIGILSFVILIFRLVSMVRNTNFVFKEKEAPRVVKVVDVKDIPKSKEQQLYEQYEDLYKRNLISKEDLDLKRKELLGK